MLTTFIGMGIGSAHLRDTPLQLFSSTITRTSFTGGSLGRVIDNNRPAGPSLHMTRRVLVTNQKDSLRRLEFVRNLKFKMPLLRVDNAHHRRVHHSGVQLGLDNVTVFVGLNGVDVEQRVLRNSVREATAASGS